MAERKLTDAQREQIRALDPTGQTAEAEVGRRFGVSPWTIRSICRRDDGSRLSPEDQRLAPFAAAWPERG